MQVDSNPIIKAAFLLSGKGETAQAWKMEDEAIAQIHEAVKAGQTHCNCPKTDCRLHGKCMDCVIVHRGHRDHLPHCLHDMVNERLAAFSALTEGSIVEKIGTKAK